MINKDFYEIVDNEIDKLVEIFKENKYLKKQNTTGKKSFGFLLWFLNNYLPQTDLNEIDQYIVEGDDDLSCDLIFENTDNFGNIVYYVVQAKWFAISNINSSNKLSKDLKACLSDFRIILSGKKNPSIRNDRFNARYDDFTEHKKKNGKIKFIFLSLCKEIEGVGANIEDFVTNLVGFDCFDIFKLKRQYIEIVYKGIKTHNPIETPYEPKSQIDLQIIKNQHIKLPRPAPYDSYIFLIKPSQIFSLFEKFGHSIFYKNIRNPLPNSFYNEKIIETIQDNPLNFWYFNNGITAITDEIFEFHPDNERISIKGIQVINGAQTVYSIYYAFLNANEIERRQMDSDSLISVRILRTGGENFDLLVTRYTNSQNPINERDFHSNDIIQKRIQEEFLKNTDIWYETRRGEFRKKTKYSRIISNQNFAQSYLAFQLQYPFSAKTKRRMIFCSTNVNTEGLYNIIFNNDTNYQNLLLSRYIFLFADKKRKQYTSKLNAIEPDENGNYDEADARLLRFDFIQYSTFELVALFKVLLEILFKSENEKEYTNKLISFYETSQWKHYENYYELLSKILEKLITEKKEKDKKINLSVYFKNRAAYPEIKSHVIKTLNKMKLDKFKF